MADILTSASPGPASRRDVPLLYATRMLRMFGYGLVSVVLVLYLAQLGFSGWEQGALLTLTLLGDTAISLWLTTYADRVGRRKMLLAGAVLMLGAGLVFVLSSSYFVLLIAATVGVISPSGNEVGPFLAVEQASLSHLISSDRRTSAFAWYNLAGSVATAVGALVAGGLASILQERGLSALGAYRMVLTGYAGAGAVLAILFLFVSRAVEVERAAEPRKLFLGLHRSRHRVFGLAGLFSMDAFAGGFVIQALVAYWFHERFGTGEAMLGGIFFGANILAGFSALSAAWLGKKFGLLNTMVFTHIPSNVLLILVPLMPSEGWAIAMLLLRYSISQMDVPTRQAFTMAVVDPDERSAAAGVTGVARTTGAALSPMIARQLLAAAASSPVFSIPFYAAGGLKIVYDLIIWRSFRAVRMREEQGRQSGGEARVR
jgi:MFS family permease